jgi:hypothetical protein
MLRCVVRNLAMSLLQLFALGWVHKSFRSGNVLYFRHAITFAEYATASISQSLEIITDMNQWPTPLSSVSSMPVPQTGAWSRPIECDEIGENVYLILSNGDCQR